MKSSRAGFCEYVKVGAAFTPVPQGCRAEKAQVVIRSVEAVSLAKSQDAASPPGGRRCVAGEILLTASTRRHKTLLGQNMADAAYRTPQQLLGSCYITPSAR